MPILRRSYCRYDTTKSTSSSGGNISQAGLSKSIGPIHWWILLWGKGQSLSELKSFPKRWSLPQKQKLQKKKREKCIASHASHTYIACAFCIPLCLSCRQPKRSELKSTPRMTKSPGSNSTPFQALNSNKIKMGTPRSRKIQDYPPQMTKAYSFSSR